MDDLDYKVLKVLYRNEPMKIGKIANKLRKPHSTLGSCVKRLEEEGYVIYERYQPVTLTENGKNLAIELNRHARLLEFLLYKELGLKPAEAHEESEKFNLLFSCNTINKICKKYEHPKQCPCGDIISNSSDCCCEKDHLS